MGTRRGDWVFNLCLKPWGEEKDSLMWQLNYWFLEHEAAIAYIKTKQLPTCLSILKVNNLILICALSDQM